MTTANTAPKASQSTGPFRMPDPPERQPDDMTSFDHLSTTGNVHYLIQHFGNPDTTLVAGEHYITPAPTTGATGVKYPDLLVAFEVNPTAYHNSNAYVISEQGKPPDFVLEIASRATGREDTTTKRDAYAVLGIPEYWRFDETGEHHGARLAGDRLVDGAYVPIDLEELPDGSLQGYSEALNLNIRWENGQLRWYDPATGRHISTFEDERNRADREQSRADEEREARIQAEAALNAALERIRQLEGHPAGDERRQEP